MFSRLDVFCGVDLDAIADVLDALVLHRLNCGVALVEAGALNCSVYILVRGRLGVLADDGEEVVDTISAGELIGEISVLDKRPCSATVIALEDCLLVEIGEVQLWSLIRSSHEFARNTLILLAQRLRSIREQFGERIERSKATELRASMDPLTGLYNRRWLDQALPLVMSGCLSRGEALGLLMMDIDHFKKYNDTHGHPAGDCVLRHVANTFKLALRNADNAARYGGEEFCVILPGADIARARTIGRRVCDFVRQTGVCKETGDPLPPVTISIGIAQMGLKETPHSLIEKADRALYRAKKGGRDRVSE